MNILKRALMLLMSLMIILPVGIPVMAEENAVTSIESALSSYKTGATINVNDDGYIGIPVDVSVYFNKAEFTAKPGYGGTPVIIYVVNTNTERIGTESDVSIISSMLERGYIVTVFDYKNSPLATGQSLDWSVQGLRANVKAKKYFTDSCFPSGTYYENHLIPAGYDVSLNNLYWEMDKHASDGTFEFIINNWNTDFRGIKGDKLLKWVREDGTRKPTANASDGSAPSWYNASGTADANGEYTKVKYTVAEKITDLVNPDGTPLELNQYMNIYYPTNPAKKVPVYTIASSSENLTSTPQVADRPHLNGALFRGYAGAVYDYAFVPMARDAAYGVYNGSKTTYAGAVTNDADNYGVHMYNDRRVTTAAMRFIRYLALSEPDKYKLDTDHIGVLGNSKGGAMSFLGEKVIQSPLVTGEYETTEALEEAIDEKINSFISRRAHDGHHNETRYQNGITESYTENGVTIDGGEKQPWLTFNGKEIISGAQLIYASNGVNEEDISEGHAPRIVMNHENDPWHYYGPVNDFATICRSHDIPTLLMEVPLAHTVAYGPDKNYNLDTYDAIFDFTGYWLKGDAVKVIYTDPLNGSGAIDVTAPIKVKFTGSVSHSEISKVTLKASDGVAVSGSWKASYGRTLWEFIPDVLCGNELYTLTVPANLKGENGMPMGEDYVSELYTRYDENIKAEGTVTTEKGTYFYFSAPELNDGANKQVIRFRVTNDAANTVKLNAVYGFNSASPDSSTVGELMGEVNISGCGYYETDVTDYLYEHQGEQVAFLLAEVKTPGITEVYSSDFSSSLNGISVAEMTSVNLGAAPDTTPSAVVIKKNTGTKYTQHVFYNNRGTPAFTVNNILGFKLSEADYGRKFTFKVDVYDTVARSIQLKLNGNSNASYGTVDYENSMYNFMTEPGEWNTYSFDYRVYDTAFGKVGLKNKNLIMSVSHTGNLELPLYVGKIAVEETVTGINADNFSVASVNDGGAAYKSPEGASAFAIYGADGEKLADYDTWKEALSAYKYGNTVKLMKNYTFTDSDAWSEFSNLKNAQGTDGHIYNIDLNGFTIKCLNGSKSLIHLKNTSAEIPETVINVYNGGIVLKDTSLISYESSTSAGKGKRLNINLTGLNIGVSDNAMTDSFISSSEAPSGSGLKVKVNLSECSIKLPSEKLTPQYKTVFPTGNDALDIYYTVAGGEISLSSQRWVKLQDKLSTCEYRKGEDGKYTVLKMPSSAKISSAAYILDGTSASSFNAVSEENYITNYELSSGILSTRYGVIPDEYESVDDYPFVWFDEAGNFKGAASKLYGVTSADSAVDQARTYMKDNKYYPSAGNYGDNPLAAFIVLRKDYTLASNETHGNLAQLQGVLTIDLNGHTLTQNGKPLVDSTAKAWSFSGDEKIFPTEIVMEHGTIAVKNNSLAHFTAWDSDGSGAVSEKSFTHTYNDVTIKLSEGATATSLFTVGTNSQTPAAKAKGNINFNNCKFDFETVSPSNPLLLFNANSQHITMKYTVSGSEIYAGTMEKITLSQTAGSSSVNAVKDEEGKLLKVYIKEENKATYPKGTITTEGGEAGFVEEGSENGYAVYTLEEIIPTFPVMTGVTVTKYVNKGTTASPSYAIETSDVFGAVTDGSLVSNDSLIQYFNPKNVTNYGLNATENANQHWLIELDQVHNLGAVELVHSRTDKWIKLNVSVSEDNQTWNELGTLEIASAGAQKTPVTLPLNSARGKYIKISVASMQGNTETQSWGPNLNSGGCSVSLYEIVSVSGVDTSADDETLTTPYGVIPSEYASADAYPFVWFDEAGNFGGASAKLFSNDDTSVTHQAKNYLKANVYYPEKGNYGDNPKAAFIVARKDYTMGSTETYGYFSQIQGTLTIDLNGFTLNQNGKPVIDSKATKWSWSGDETIFPTNVVIKNGGITLKNNSIIHFASFDSTAAGNIADKQFNYLFENVKVSLANGAVTNLFTFETATANLLNGAKATLEIKDCEFDFNTVAPSGELLIFNANGPYITSDYKVIGSEIYASSMENISIYSAIEGSSVEFEKNENDKYLTLYVKTENKETVDDLRVITGEGEKSFVEWGNRDSYTVFSLAENPLVTKYGIIPDEYASVEDYPVVWFDEAGNFKGGAKELFGTSSSTTSPVHLAKTYLRGNVYNPETGSYGANPLKAYILLRADYEMAANEAYGSLTQIQGTLTIDLNGHTLKQNTKPLVNSISIRWSWSYDEAIFPTELVIENGTIILKDNGLVTFTAWDSNGSGDIADKDFIHTYNNVKVQLAENATVTELFKISQHTGTPTAKTDVFVNMNDCVFDFEALPSAGSLLMFDADGEYIRAEYRVKGSEIYASSMENIVLSEVAGNSSVTALKNEKGDYLKVYIPEGNEGSFGSEKIVTGEGELVFSETAKVNGYSVFTPGNSPEPAVTGSNLIFASFDYFALTDGRTYFGPVGVVFAKAPYSAGDYTRTECGILFSKKDIDRETFMADNEAVALKADSARADGTYGIKLFGTGIRLMKTYYALPYAKYEDSNGNELTVYGEKVLTFSPRINE